MKAPALALLVSSLLAPGCDAASDEIDHHSTVFRTADDDATWFCAQFEHSNTDAAIMLVAPAPGRDRALGAHADHRVTADIQDHDDAFISTHLWEVHCDLFDTEVYLQSTAHGTWLTPRQSGQEVQAEDCRRDDAAWAPRYDQSKGRWVFQVESRPTDELGADSHGLGSRAVKAGSGEDLVTGFEIQVEI